MERRRPCVPVVDDRRTGRAPSVIGADDRHAAEAMDWLALARSGVGGVAASGIILAACSAFLVGVGTFTTRSTDGRPQRVHVGAADRSAAALASPQPLRPGRRRTVVRHDRSSVRVGDGRVRAAALPHAAGAQRARPETDAPSPPPRRDSSDPARHDLPNETADHTSTTASATLPVSARLGNSAVTVVPLPAAAAPPPALPPAPVQPPPPPVPVPTSAAPPVSASPLPTLPATALPDNAMLP